MSSTRETKSPGIWAADASTVIPTSPIAGETYRDAVSGAANVRTMGKYGLKINSQEFNQILFQYATLLDIMDTQGVLGWSDIVDYSGIGVVLGSDGRMYSLLQASGPDHGGAQDPTSTVGYWKDLTPPSRYSTGEYVYTATSAAPAGTVKCDGSTIGNVGSGATALAALSAFALFTSLWNDHSNTVLTIQTSGGVPTSRGASAAADWAALKRLPVPALRDGDAIVAAVSSGLTTQTNGQVIQHSHSLTMNPVGDHNHGYPIENLDGPDVRWPNGHGGATTSTAYTNNGGGHTPSGTIGQTGNTVNQAGGLFANVWIAL